MSFRVLMCLVVFLLFVVSCSGSGISTSETSQEEQAKSSSDRPNMIFILTDDLDFASVQKMPEIRSQLIEKGLSFEKTFVSHPICHPSRAIILTGLHDHNHGVKDNAPRKGVTPPALVLVSSRFNSY